MAHDLARFVDAQEAVIDTVRRELRAGRKQSHWMWFVFPQLRGLGRSATAKFYGIASREEATAYLRHPVLGPRLLECTDLVNAITDRCVYDIFGSPDDLKFRSCMTLFHRVDGAEASFAKALETFYGGAADPETLRLLAAEGSTR